MEILDGDNEGLARAVECVAANPNPAHLMEDRIVLGRDRGIGEMLSHSLLASGVAAYAMNNGEAMVGGVTLNPVDGMLRHEIWLLTTAGAPLYPWWMVREGRRMLDSADKVLKWPHRYVQKIPSSYRAGVAYAQKRGFYISRAEGDGSHEVFVMERMIPRWVQ